MGDLDAGGPNLCADLQKNSHEAMTVRLDRVAWACLRTSHSVSVNFRRFDVKVFCWDTYSLAFIKALDDVNARAENPAIHP